jgi:hypothetical protein
VIRCASLLLIGLLALAGSAAPGAGAAPAPPGFAGISPQSPLTEKDVALMQLAGVSSVRMPMNWNAIQPRSRFFNEPDFDGFDHSVRLAAEYGIGVLPVLSNTPDWLAPDPIDLPIDTAAQRWAWKSFLRDAARRYGPNGSFWDENPETPYVPIRQWEIWNEENIVTFANPASPERFAVLLRLAGRVLHRFDPRAKVLIGGLFGRPLQIPPNVSSGDFLSRLYRARHVKRYFDGVALHPYVSVAAAMRAQIENLRRVMRLHHDAATPLYVTELGWGSDSGESRWERGPYGQAQELDRAFAMLVGKRRAWRIGGLWWFSWSDEGGACQFCDSAGLLTADREAKPAWYRFNAWTGGDPDFVPRASLE